MIIGQLVAISVASNLFYLAIVLSPRPRTTKAASSIRVPPVLWASTFIGLVCVYRSPATSVEAFLPNLLAMHSIIVVPLLFIHSQNYTAAIPLTYLYSVYTMLSVGMRVKTTLSAREESSDFLADAWSTLHSHPAQSSIGYDVVWTTVSYSVWALLDKGIVLSSLLSPLLSVAVTASASAWLGGLGSSQKTKL